MTLHSHSWAYIWGKKKPWSKSERLHFHFSLSCIGEGNGNPLQCSCLVNPRNGRAWWAAVCGITQSWTQLKWLSSSSRRILHVQRLSLWLASYLFNLYAFIEQKDYSTILLLKLTLWWVDLVFTSVVHFLLGSLDKIFFFLLYNILLVLPYINMNLPQVYTCSPSWGPLPLPKLW